MSSAASPHTEEPSNTEALGRTLPAMSLLGATILTAIATLVLAVFAFITAVLAFLAWRKQSREVSDQASMLKVQSDRLDEQRKINQKQTEVLELQARELNESLAERKREAERRHRDQAAHVFLTEKRWPAQPRGPLDSEPPLITATAHNTSDQPVYDADLRWHQGPGGYGEPNPEPIGTVRPDMSVRRERKFPSNAHIEHCGAALRFTDAAGTRWIRRADGYLAEYPPDAGQLVM